MMIEVQGELNEVDLDHLEDETQLDTYEGELLVLRRLLHAQDSSSNKEPREMIFHSWCTIEDKVCNLIINGGSYTNVACTLLIEKLGIPTISHP